MSTHGRWISNPNQQPSEMSRNLMSRGTVSCIEDAHNLSPRYILFFSSKAIHKKKRGWAPPLRASNEHILIVRVVRAKATDPAAPSLTSSIPAARRPTNGRASRRARLFAASRVWQQWPHPIEPPLLPSHRIGAAHCPG